MKPILVVTIPEVGEVRLDRHGNRLFRPVPGSPYRTFDRIADVERALVRGCRTRSPAPEEQIEALLRAFPGSAVGVLTDERSEAPKPTYNGRWQSPWGA